MEQVGITEASNGQRDGSNGGDTSLYSKSEKSFPEERKKSSNEIVDQGQGRQNSVSSSSNNSSAAEPKVPRISESKPPSNVHGFENEKLHLQILLSKPEKDGDNLKAIGVIGLPGVGKTTLCQSIFHSEFVKRQFVPRIWVPLSGLKKAEAIIRMLERLGVYQETISSFQTNHGLNGLRYILHQELIGKRYLIVLDDLQSEYIESTDLSDLFPKGYRGTVIVTGRNEKFIEKIVGEEKLHQLQPLTDQESCWLIYRDSVRARAKDVELHSRIKKEFDEEIEKLKREQLSEENLILIEERKMNYRDPVLELNLQDAKDFENEVKELEDKKLSDTKPLEEKKAKQREQKKNAEELKRKCGGIPLAAKLLGEIKAEEELRRKPNLLLAEIKAEIKQKQRDEVAEAANKEQSDAEAAAANKVPSIEKQSDAQAAAMKNPIQQTNT